MNDRPHQMMVQEVADEAARMGFVADLKRFLTNELSGGSRFVYEGSVRPALERDLGHAPTRHNIRRSMADQPFYQAVSSLRRTTQEMIWDTSGECAERQVSFLLLHETSNTALSRIFAESHRLLRPGGVMVHVDSLPYKDLTPWDQFVPDWDTHYPTLNPSWAPSTTWT